MERAASLRQQLLSSSTYDQHQWSGLEATKMTKAQGRKGNPDSSTSSFTGQPGEKQFDNMITHFVRCFIIMFIEIPLAVCFIKCFIICFPKWTDQPINQLTERPSDRPDQPSKSVSQFWLSIDSKSNIQGRNRI